MKRMKIDFPYKIYIRAALNNDNDYSSKYLDWDQGLNRKKWASIPLEKSCMELNTIIHIFQKNLELPKWED